MRTASHSLSNQVAILDAGAQYAKVIDRKIRSLGVESHLLPMNSPASQLEQFGAIIISGGPESVYGKDSPSYDPALFQLKRPILGICYGMQLLSHVRGGKVEKKAIREDGPCQISVEPSSPLFNGLSQRQQVLMTHGDTVDVPGKGFLITATSDKLIAAIEDPQKQWYGVQFHPEVDLTEHGQDIFANFLFTIAKLTPSYTVKDREQLAVQGIQRQVGNKTALVLASGGVDSTVAAALVTKALGQKHVIAIHIDHGFMRQNESTQVIEALRKVQVPVTLIDAKDTFATATTIIDGEQTPPLNESTNPEQKRKIIGDTFMKVAEKAVADLNLTMDQVFLVQGTLRPDLIESASRTVSKTAQTIKTHHNDTASVRKLRDAGRVVEPLAEYHKDEVRELGTALGLPSEIIWRQPFPGPGLAIRTLCAQQPYQTADFSSIEDQLQTFARSDISTHLLPVQTVGIQGDGRTYSYLAALSGNAEWPTLVELARAIPKRIHAINRVVYAFGEQLPLGQSFETITPTHLTSDVLDQLRAADQIVNDCLQQFSLLQKLSQVPVILFPVDFAQPGKRSIGIRTFITNDFMTGLPAVPGKDVPEEAVQTMAQRILKEVPGIARVVYDLTSKPPGTTEWE